MLFLDWMQWYLCTYHTGWEVQVCDVVLGLYVVVPTYHTGWKVQEGNVVLGLDVVIPTYDTGWEVQEGNVVLGLDVGHDVLVEELEDEGDTVGKHQVLGHELELGKERENSVGRDYRVFEKITGRTR